MPERRNNDRLKPKDIAEFAAKEAVGAIPFVGQIIKDAIDEFSEDEKGEFIRELKELSESQFKGISEKAGFSVEYLEGIRKFTLYSFKELRADHEEIKELIRSLIEIQTRGVEAKPSEINIPTIQSVLKKGATFEGDFLEEQMKIEENIINQLIALSEITEMEERGKKRTLSLSHSSIADLYHQLLHPLIQRTKKIFA